MKKIHHHNRALKSLMEHWSKLCQLRPDHRQWVSEHCECISTRRGQWLTEEGTKHTDLFIVTEGAIANIYGSRAQQYPVLNVAIPMMALSSTVHVFSDTPVAGAIQVIRSGQVLRLPYKNLRSWFHEDPCLDHLFYMLANKQIRFHYLLRQIRNIKTLRERYVRFCELLPEFVGYLNEFQQAQLLGISRSTLQAAKLDLLRKPNS